MISTRLRAVWVCLLVALAALGWSFVDVVQWSGRLDPAKVAPNQDAVVVVTAKIDEGWHLYSTKPLVDGPVATKFAVPEGQKWKVSGAIQQGPAEKKFDPNFNMEVEQYAKTAEFRIPVRIPEDAAQGAAKGIVEVTFQTCDDKSCMPPKTVPIEVAYTVEGDKVENAAVGAIQPEGGNPRQAGLLKFCLFAMGMGFLALLTPCVFPMVPITVTIFSKQKQEAGWRGSVTKALAFCVGIIASFTAIGVVASLLIGASGVQTVAANPWLNLTLAGIFIVLALNLFGVYEIAIPSGLANKIDTGKGGFLGPVLMGLVFSLTSFTCTMPFVGTLLVSAATGDLLFPIVGMVGFSLAMSIPFFFLALFPSAISALPRAGAWMSVTKAFMGFLELAAAVKFLSNADLVWNVGLLTRPVFLALWAAIMGVAGFYMLGALQLPKVPESRPGPVRLGIGVASIACSIWFLGAINGRPLGELDAFLPPSDYAVARTAATMKDDGNWVKDYEAAVAQAKAAGKPLLIDFTGVTCTNCRWMESNMFTRPDVKQAFDGFVLAKLYTDRPTDEDRANQKLQQDLVKTVTLPVYAVVTPDGKVHAVHEGIERDPSRFLAWMEEGRAKAGG